FLNYREVTGAANDLTRPAEQTSGPLAGDRAADAHGLRRGFARYDIRLFDLLRGPKFTLLLYTTSATPGEDCERFAKLADAVRERFPGLIEIYAIIHPDCGPPEIEGLGLIVDGQNEFARIYGARSGGGFLIRPDGYVGYRGEPITSEKLCAWLGNVLR